MKLFSRIFSMLFLAFAFSVLFCAPTFAEESLSITVDGTPTVEATPNELGTASADVYVTSTARDGYKLSISDSDNENALVSGQGNTINALSESVTADNFTTNAWGVKVGDNFLPVPKLNDNVLDLAATSAPATNEKHTVTFGMKTDSTTVSGAYSTEVVFTVVANPLSVRRATLQTGQNVNAAWKTLANDTATLHTATDNKITSAQKFTGEFTDTLRAAAQDIATSDSDWPVYTWFDNGIIYYYTEADEVFFNADSSYMFYAMKKLVSVDFNFGLATDVDPDSDGFIDNASDPVYITSEVTTIARMFQDDSALTTLDVSKWDTSNITNMATTFRDASSLTSLNVSSWDTSKVTKMNNMFHNATALATLDVSHWDTSNVDDISYIFCNTRLNTIAVDSWNTSKVTRMSFAFAYTRSLTSLNVSGWDVSKVIYASSMFESASALTTLDVSRWDTGNIVHASHMFDGATSINGLNVTNWNTGKITEMHYMFSNTPSLTALDVSRWDTSKVINFANMFAGASALTYLDVSSWNTGNATNMSDMFNNATSLATLDVSRWNTGKVTITDGMFRQAVSLTTLNVTDWNTGNITNMDRMFLDASGLTTLDVSKWDVAKVKSTSLTFAGASALTALDVSDWNVGADRNMYFMFAGASSLDGLDVSDWDTSSVTNMESMFAGVTFASLDISGWDTSNVENMSGMFRSTTALTGLDFSDWDTSKVERMGEMFYNAAAITTLDLSSWDTSKVAAMDRMFNNATALTTIYASDQFVVGSSMTSINMFTDSINLVGSNGTTYDANHVTKEYAHIDVAGNPGYFSEKIVVRKAILQTGKLVNAAWKTLAKGSAATYTEQDNAITSIKKYTGDFTDSIQSTAIDIAVEESESPVWTWYDNGIVYYHTEADEVFLNTDSGYMFYGMSGLTSIDFNFGVETDVDPDGDGFIASVQDPVYITSSVTDMRFMFFGASSLITLDVSNYDTSSVTNMSSMFRAATSLTTLDVSNWDTSSVADMNGMFYYASSLTSLDVSNWDTSSVTNMNNIFRSASSLTSLDVSNWDTSSVAYMNFMFSGASSITSLDVSNWDTSKVTDMHYMFSNASALTTIYASDKFNTNAVINGAYMFEGTSRLVGGNGTVYDADHTDKEYARIDKPGTPGYFTEKQRAVRKATLKSGSEINNIWRFTLNADPTSVERFTGTFTDALQNAAINIAISTSDYPVYTWNSGSTIYYYTEADEVYLNSDSAAMFGKLSNLRSIDFNFGLESDVDPDGDGYVGLMSEPVFITSNVTSMGSMFYYTGITTLDLSGMDTRNVTDMSEMFEGSSSLTTIYASNLFNTNAVTDSSWMFIDATNLTGGNGTTYNSSHTDKEYARIDAPTTPGYFTLKSN